MDGSERVAQTWEEIGFKVRPLKYWAFVRTEPLYQRTEGGIWLSPKESDFYGSRMAHQVLIRAVVCSTGPVAKDHYGFKPGQRVVFKRLHFAHLRKMSDGTYFGWINAAEIVGEPIEMSEAEERWLQGHDAPVAPEVAAEYAMGG